MLHKIKHNSQTMFKHMEGMKAEECEETSRSGILNPRHRHSFISSRALFFFSKSLAVQPKLSNIHTLKHLSYSTILTFHTLLLHIFSF